MIIDSHVHLKHGGGQEYRAEEIVRVMKAVGIERSVVFAMSTTTRRSIALAQEATARFPGKLIPYAYALPSYEEDALGALRGAVSELGFRGFKLHAYECILADYASDPVFALAGELGVPCLVDCVGRHEEMRQVAQRFPQTRIIVAHLGRYLSTDEALLERFLRLAEEQPNIRLDVSGVVMVWRIKDAVQRIGSERVIFGSDGPHEAPDTIGYARTELDKIRMLRLARSDEENVLGGAIARLLALEA